MTTKLQYDNGGNLLADDRARYTYDVFNRTEKVETFDGHVQINRYDAEGLRHELEEDGKLVQFIFRGDEVVAEKTDDKIIRLIRGYDLVASDAENAKTYYHYASNELGSITHVVDDRDVLNHYEYDVWGNLAVCEEAVPNRFLFTGQQYDGTIQQYYLRARFYNPAIARFTQEDTYRGDGQNLYTYCRNNPVCYVDPSGYCSKDPDGNQAGGGNDGELLLPAVIPTQLQLPAVIDTPQKQLPAVIDNYQNGINGPEANTPNNQNRTNSSEGGRRADFYVTPNGDAVPSTAYRYMSTGGSIDAWNKGEQYATYFGFEKIDSAAKVQDRFQISPEWSDCKVRGTFDTLQIIDVMYVPTTQGNTTNIPEPFATSYKEYGNGGAQQFRADTIIKFLKVENIGD